MDITKVVLITNIPTPYRIPLFNEIHRQLSAQGLSLEVIFGALRSSRRRWNPDLGDCRFSYRVLASRSIAFRNPEKIMLTYSGLGAILAREDSPLLITNGFSLATTKLWFRSWRTMTPYLIWSGDISPRDRKIPVWRILQRKIVSRRALGFVAYGSKARSYLESLGVPAEKITIGINTVDTEYFQKETEKLRDKNAERHSKKRLLYVGDLTPTKRVDLLLAAIRILSLKRQDFLVLLVGDGSEKENLRRLAGQFGLQSYLSFEGFRHKEDIPSYLAAADCFLFPTGSDVWGLALVEAMAAGVPCISSIRAGATEDLIYDGVNGFIGDFTDGNRIADRIDWILNHPADAARMGQLAKTTIREKASISTSAAGFVQAILRARRLMSRSSHAQEPA